MLRLKVVARRPIYPKLGIVLLWSAVVVVLYLLLTIRVEHTSAAAPTVVPPGQVNVWETPIAILDSDGYNDFQLPFGGNYNTGATNSRWPITQWGTGGDPSHACSPDDGVPYPADCGAIDFALPAGTPVYATYDGEVAGVGWASTTYGQWIVVRHSYNGMTLYSIYAHLTQNSVVFDEGDPVAIGQFLALSGDTGAGAAHLHFGISRQKPNNPAQYQAVYIEDLPGIVGDNAVGAPEFFPEPCTQQGGQCVEYSSQALNWSQALRSSFGTLVGTRIGNDAMESLRVPAGQSVTVYEHSIGQGLGRSLRFDGPIWVSNLASVGGVNLSNQVSAISVCETGQCAPIASQVLCVAPTAIATSAPCANPTAYVRIQDAIAAAQSGAEIRIAGGTYRNQLSPMLGSDPKAPASPVIAVGKNVALVGGYSTSDWNSAGSPSLTVIDGQGSRAVEVQGTNSPTIQNLTVSNGGIQNDNGTVNVYGGSLIVGSGSSNGHFYIAGGSQASMSGILEDGTNFSGGGQMTGNPTINGAVTFENVYLSGGSFGGSGNITVRNLDMSGGSISGSGTIQVTRRMNWSGGTIGGILSIAAGANFNITGSNVKSLQGAIINNSGNSTWTGTGNLLFQQNSIFNNIGTFDVQNDQAVNMTYGYTGVFNNSGTFTKSAGTGATYFVPNFNNNGTVKVQSGDLQVMNGTSNGNFNVSAGAFMTFMRTGCIDNDCTAVHNYTTGTTFTGGGVTRIWVPVARATGSINAQNLEIAGGALIVSDTLTVPNLTMSSGTLVSDGIGVITITDDFNWLGGSVATWGVGSVDIAPTAVMNISGSAVKYLSGRINNAGTATWTGTGNLPFGAGAIFNNSGTFDVQNDQVMQSTYGYQYQTVFNNSGVLMKSQGTSATLFGVVFNNTGTVNVNSGSLWLQSGASNGHFDVSNGALLWFHIISCLDHYCTGNHTFAAGTNFTGAGITQMGSSGSNLTIAMSGPVTAKHLSLIGSSITVSDTLAVQNLDLSGALNTADSVSVADTLNWTGGYIIGTGTTTIAPGATLNISGSSQKYLRSHLINQGTTIWSGTGNLMFEQWGPGVNAVFDNIGTFTAQNDQVMQSSYGHQYDALFNNIGTFTKSQSIGTTSFVALFNNTGTVNVQSGSLDIQSGASDGHFDVSSGALLWFHINACLDNNCTGNHMIAGGGSFTGAGTTQMGSFGTNLTIAMSGSVTAQNLNLQGPGAIVSGTLSVGNLDVVGALNTSGAVTVNGMLNWTGGYIIGTGTTTIAPGATLNISGSSQKYLRSHLINQGTATWSGTGNLEFQQYGPGVNAVFDNLGLFDIQNDQSLNLGGGSPYFQNSGNLRKTAGSSTSSINIPLTTSGVVEVVTGTLLFGSSYVQSAGITTVNGGTVLGAGTFNIQGGMLRGSGTVGGTIINSGMLSPGASPGILTITGNYTQSPTGTLSIEIGGTTPGTQYDRLQVNGTATLSGTLNISTTNGFAPTPSDTFQVLTFASRVGSGTFSSITGLALPNGNSYTPTYNSTNFTLGVRGPNVLRGHITWQGRPAQPSSLQQMPITLTLTLNGTNYSYPALTTDASGYFTATVGMLPVGTYNWWVKGPQHLASSGTVALAGAPTTNQEMGLMRAGDVNNDNIIDISDFSILRGTFGKACGDPGYNGNADFTGDCIVDISDFSLLRGNFGQSGAPPLGPANPQGEGPVPSGTGTPTATEAAMAIATATIPVARGDAYLELRPQGGTDVPGGSTKAVNVGDKVVLDLWVNSGTNTNLIGQSSYLTFTNELLQNVVLSSSSGSCIATNTITGDLSIFDAPLQNEVCNGPGPCLFRGTLSAPGSIAYASGVLTGNPNAGKRSFRVGQISFCAVAPGEATIHWKVSSTPGTRPATGIVNQTGLLVSNPNLFADYTVRVVAGTK